MPLYLVSTPIGNLEDMTLRAIRVLKEVDLIACEDTRHTQRLLEHFGIRKPLISYHEHNERDRAEELAARLVQGESIAIVTDAGSPGISDPAYRVTRAAIDRGIAVIPIPGATAIIPALAASGLPSDQFLFCGFLPPKQKARRSRLEELKEQRATLVFYEAPHRIRETLEDALGILGDREASLAREVTKLHEEFLRGPLSKLIAHFENAQPRGEMALVIAGNSAHNSAYSAEISILEQVEGLIREKGLSRSDAIKAAAASRGLNKREAYRLLVEERDSKENSEKDAEAYDESESE